MKIPLLIILIFVTLNCKSAEKKPEVSGKADVSDKKTNPHVVDGKSYIRNLFTSQKECDKAKKLSGLFNCQQYIRFNTNTVEVIDTDIVESQPYSQNGRNIIIYSLESAGSNIDSKFTISEDGNEIVRDDGVTFVLSEKD